MTSLKLGCEYIYLINFWTRTSWHSLLGCQEANVKKPTPKSPSGHRLPDTAFLAAKKPMPRTFLAWASWGGIIDMLCLVNQYEYSFELNSAEFGRFRPNFGIKQSKHS